MTQFSKFASAIALVLVLQGCSARVKQITSLEPQSPTTKSTLAVNEPSKAPIPHSSPPLNLSSSTPANQPRVISHPQPEPTAPQWTSLDAFSKKYGLKVTSTTTRENKTYVECSNTDYRIRFCIGSKQAYFNGMEFWLGFPPQNIGGLPALKSVDVEKSLAPLFAKDQGLTKTKVIVIDPGHGGENLGTRAAEPSSYEKYYTLDWAKRLRTMLLKDGFKVFLTRTNDIHLTLPERVAFADNVRADLFISLHFNSAGSQKVLGGLETYYLTPQGMPSTLTREFDDNPENKFPNNAFDAQNLRLAMNLHRAIVDHTGAEDRGVRKARFMGILKTQARPAVLLEGGYLSNPEEARKISSPAYRQKLAEAVALALVLPTPPFEKAVSELPGKAPTKPVPAPAKKVPANKAKTKAK